MGDESQRGLEPTLRLAVASGDFGTFGELLAPDAVLDSSSEADRVVISGAEAILDHLGRIGPGEVLDWDAREWPSGLAATFEWRGASGTDRRRWYVRREAGRVARIWSYAARPAGDETARVGDAVLRRVGEGARRAPLEHSGNSGAALERILLPDGTALIAKRVGPSGDWLARVTGDRGRTALLWEEGAFARLPDELDHGIEKVIPDGEGLSLIHI